MPKTKYLRIKAAQVTVGYSVKYEILVNGYKVRTTGTVQKIRRVGKTDIEITLKHRKTGEIHVNVMPGVREVLLYAAFLQDGYTQEVQAGLPWEGMGEMWTESLVKQLHENLDSNLWKFCGLPIESPVQP